MLPAARIEAAIELMAAIIASDRPAEAVVSAYFRDRRYMGSKDRAAINARVYRIIRSYHRLSWQIGDDVTPRALVIADVVLAGEHTAMELIELFSGARFAPAQLDKGEVALARKLEGKTLDDPDAPLRVRGECPEWAFDSLQRSLGENFETEMRALSAPNWVDVRVNTIKATREDVLAKFKKDGVEAAAGTLSPWAVRLTGRPRIAEFQLYKDGVIEVQDEGSQMIAVLAAAQPGTQVLDYCAGAGGKTLALGAAMQNKGRIVASDVLAGRLEKAKLRFRRAGLHNIETHALGEPGDKFPKRHKNYFDLVLVDAPCSGSGTWRREPDRRWRQLGPKLEELLPLQREILGNAAKLVKPGGRLVYATCSLLDDENGDQVAAFLKEHTDFTAEGEPLKLTPARHGTDGFFAARLRRNA